VVYSRIYVAFVFVFMITSEQKSFCCFYVTDRDKKVTFCSWADRHGTWSLVSLRQLVSWWRSSGTRRTVAWNKGGAGRPTFRRNLLSPSSIQSSALQTFSFVEPFSRTKYFMAPHPCFWDGNNFFPHGPTAPSEPRIPHYPGFTITVKDTDLTW